MGKQDFGRALNVELVEGKVPEWIQLVPPGLEIVGVDGRRFVNRDPAGVVAAHRTMGMDAPVDWEHATERRASEGLEAPAAGWIKEMEVREGGSIWARVEWTERGAAAIASREYRYISPVYVYSRKTLQLRGIPSVALTNSPNLRQTALNNRQQNEQEEEPMLKKLLAALGVAEDATEETALNAVSKLKTDLATAENRAETPSLDKFVPRADYDVACNRAATAEQKLKDRAAAELEKEITTEVDAAVKAGKVTPGTKDFYTAMCRQEGGLEQFKKFIEAAPVVGDASGLDGKETPGGSEIEKGLNSQIAGMFGNSVEDIKKYGLKTA